MLVAWDIVLTLLHPMARGPISYMANRATWRAARWASLHVLGGRGLSHAGPLAVVTNVLAWVIGMWMGYALVYLPSVEAFSYDPTTPFAQKGAMEALYVSGAALTTVGFGDVVATGELLRLFTVAEAATGFGVLSAAIAFVLALHPLVTQLRSTGLQLADSGALAPGGAARLLEQAGPSELALVLRQLTESHENVRRFPVLYYFESGNRNESLSALVRGSTLLLVALRCGQGRDGGPASVYAEALEKAIGRLLEDLQRDFVGGRRRKLGQLPLADDTGQRLREVCSFLSPHDFEPNPEDAVPDGLDDLVAQAEAVLGAVAVEHGHDAAPILSV